MVLARPLPLGLEPALARAAARTRSSRPREFEWLQLLTHPEIWVYPGETMRETMHSMLDAERERDLERLAADRIDLS